MNNQNVIYRIKSMINSAAGSAEHGNKLFMIFAAMYASQNAVFPQGPVADLGKFIVENEVDIKVRRLLSPINEAMAFDFAAAARLAMQFYNLRYGFAYGGTESMAFIYTALTNVTGDAVVADAQEVLNGVRDNKKVSDTFNSCFRIAMSEDTE